MIALYILLGILGLLVLLLLIPAGVWLRYSSEGFHLKVIYGPIRLQLMPKKPRKIRNPEAEERKKQKKLEKKQQKDAQKKAKKAEEKKKQQEAQRKREKAGIPANPVPGATELPQKGGSVKQLLEYVPVALRLLDAIRVRLLLRKLVLLVNLGGDDPADLAEKYGKVTAAVASSINLLERAFRIRRRDVQVYFDFMADGTEVYAELDLVVSPIRILAIAIRYGWQALMIYLKQQKSKKEVQ